MWCNTDDHNNNWKTYNNKNKNKIKPAGKSGTKKNKRRKEEQEDNKRKKKKEKKLLPWLHELTMLIMYLLLNNLWSSSSKIRNNS